MKNFLNLCLFFLAFQVYGVVNAQEFPDPNRLLRKADSTLSQIQSISFHIETYFLGAMKMGEQTMFNPPSQGAVIVDRISEKDTVGARLFVDGQILNQDKEFRIKCSYDGEKIRSIDDEKQVLYVNDPDDQGLFLLGMPDHFFMLQLFRSASPLKDEMAAKETKFDGYAVVDGIPCNVVFVQYQDHRFLTSARWFLGQDDNLPRKIVSNMKAQNNEIIRVTSLSRIKVNSNLDASVFQIEAPEGYQIKAFSFALPPGTPAPDWTLSDPQGKQWSLADFKGQVVIVDFWATWCKPCIAAMPKLQELHEQFSEQGVKVIGISTWEKGGDPAKLIAEKQLTYQMLINGDEVAQKYKVSALPTLYIIGADGTIIYGEPGYEPEQFEKILNIVQFSLANK